MDRSANNEAVVAELEEVWVSVNEACTGLTVAEWELPTACPGWTVRDQVSHLIGVEKTILGDPPPPSLDQEPSYIRNPFGAANEAWIEARRTVPGDEVLAELAEVSDRRLASLRAMTTEAFDVVGWSPAGQVPYREFMATRIMDIWAHEQDIRRAVGRPGGRNQAGERVSLARCAQAMPFVVGKKVSPPEGTSVLFVVTGLLGFRLPVEVSDGRARVSDQPTDQPTVTITMGQELFCRLGFGRTDPVAHLDDGSVTVVGDVDLGRSVVSAMPFMI